MNFFPVQSLLGSTSIFIENQIIKPLTAQQQKVASVALVIFSFLASTVFIYCYFFRANRVEIEKEPDIIKEEDNSQDNTHPRFEEFKLAVQQNGLLLKDAPEELRKNRTIVKLAVQNTGWALQFAEDFQNDEEIVKLAVQQDGYALQFASSNLQNNFEIVKLAVKQNGYTVQFAGDDLRKNKVAMKQLMEIAVVGDGLALEFASPELRNDRTIVKLAVQQNKLALQFASSELQNDPEMIQLTEQQKASKKEVQNLGMFAI